MDKKLSQQTPEMMTMRLFLGFVLVLLWCCASFAYYPALRCSNSPPHPPPPLSPPPPKSTHLPFVCLPILHFSIWLASPAVPHPILLLVSVPHCLPTLPPSPPPLPPLQSPEMWTARLFSKSVWVVSAHPCAVSSQPRLPLSHLSIVCRLLHPSDTSVDPVHQFLLPGSNVDFSMQPDEPLGAQCVMYMQSLAALNVGCQL